MGYTRNPFWQWENEVSQTTAGLIGVIAITVAAIVLTLILILLKEMVRIYQTHALHQNSTTAKQLWAALVIFIGVWLLCAGLAAIPGLAVLAGYIASWSLFIFVVFVEVTDMTASRSQVPPEEEGVVLGETVA